MIWVFLPSLNSFRILVLLKITRVKKDVLGGIKLNFKSSKTLSLYLNLSIDNYISEFKILSFSNFFLRIVMKFSAFVEMRRKFTRVSFRAWTRYLAESSPRYVDFFLNFKLITAGLSIDEIMYISDSFFPRMIKKYQILVDEYSRNESNHPLRDKVCKILLTSYKLLNYLYLKDVPSEYIKQYSKRFRQIMSQHWRLDRFETDTLLDNIDSILSGKKTNKHLVSDRARWDAFYEISSKKIDLSSSQIFKVLNIFSLLSKEEKILEFFELLNKENKLFSFLEKYITVDMSFKDWVVTRIDSIPILAQTDGLLLLSFSISMRNSMIQIKQPAFRTPLPKALEFDNRLKPHLTSFEKNFSQFFNFLDLSSKLVDSLAVSFLLLSYQNRLLVHQQRTVSKNVKRCYNASAITGLLNYSVFGSEQLQKTLSFGIPLEVGDRIAMYLKNRDIHHVNALAKGIRNHAIEAVKSSVLMNCLVVNAAVEEPSNCLMP